MYHTFSGFVSAIHPAQLLLYWSHCLYILSTPPSTGLEVTQSISVLLRCPNLSPIFYYEKSQTHKMLKEFYGEHSRPITWSGPQLYLLHLI